MPAKIWAQPVLGDRRIDRSDPKRELIELHFHMNWASFLGRPEALAKSEALVESVKPSDVVSVEVDGGVSKHELSRTEIEENIYSYIGVEKKFSKNEYQSERSKVFQLKSCIRNASARLGALSIVFILVALSVFGIYVYSSLRYPPATESLTQVTNFSWHASFPIIVNYSGMWNLVYLVDNATMPINGIQNNIHGNLNGTGYYRTSVTMYGVGYGEKTLCATATKLDSQNLVLSLTVDASTDNTTNSSRSALVCLTVAP
jgi:hypothetical protein